MKKRFLFEVNEKAKSFLACETLQDLRSLGFDTNQIVLKAMHPPYYRFETRKKNGGIRIIEAPKTSLKSLQRQFNVCLQCVYYLYQTQAAYGYIIRVKHARKYKNILENARQHLGAKYMLNVDFENFFHQITTKRVKRILASPPFQFNKKTANVLARLFTHHGRLPMGAPTSPVFSNLASRQLDEALSEWAIEHKMIYTRFVDDLSFSTKEKPISHLHLERIQQICAAYQLQLNLTKTKFYDAKMTKKVTGLVLNETIDIDPEFYNALDKNLHRLRHMAEVSIIMNQHNRSEALQQFKKEVDGQINFIGMIEGYDSPIFYQYRQALKAALHPEEEALSARWTNANYF